MIIGLNGKMGVGKSTAAALISNISARPVKLIKFAAPLYDMQEYIYRRIASAHTRPSGFIKDRKLLQWLGTEWGRGTISETLWVDLWAAEVKKAEDCGFVIVCDDVRFDNEARTVRGMSGLVINIQSTHADARITTNNGIANHTSEQGVQEDLISHVIHNDSTERDFEQRLTALLTEEGLQLRKELF